MEQDKIRTKIVQLFFLLIVYTDVSHHNSSCFATEFPNVYAASHFASGFNRGFTALAREKSF